MKHLAFWTEQSSIHESLKFIKELALSHAHEGGPQGESIAILIGSDAYSELCDLDP